MSKKQQWLVKATYQEASEWVLDRDLDDAHHWYVKWDRLEVQWEEGGSFETIYPATTLPQRILISNVQRM